MEILLTSLQFFLFRDLLTEVTRCRDEGIPVPSEAWLQYQFWPKDPSKQSTS